MPGGDGATHRRGTLPGVRLNAVVAGYSPGAACAGLPGDIARVFSRAHAIRDTADIAQVRTRARP